MMSPITKYASSIVDGARVASTIAHARQTAIHERPGAVHIELPEDIAGHDVHPTYADIIPYQKIRRPQIDEKQLTQLISALE
jgi:acetolactate synthase-1/2/3 large subunit